MPTLDSSHELALRGCNAIAGSIDTFLILLLNDKQLMVVHVNTRSITISTAYGVSVLFPELFGSSQ